VLAESATVMFSHPSAVRSAPAAAGWPRPARAAPEARDALREFLGGRRGAALDDASCRAHQRLLREFLTEHSPTDARCAPWSCGRRRGGERRRVVILGTAGHIDHGKTRSSVR
jgi:hypothetical protein